VGIAVKQKIRSANAKFKMRLVAGAFLSFFVHENATSVNMFTDDAHAKNEKKEKEPQCYQYNDYKPASSLSFFVSRVEQTDH
jgi:hypothetical protein